MTDCALCGLPTPDPPIRGDDEQAFCCRGCREVAAAVEDVDAADPDEALDRLGDGEADSAVDDAEAELFLSVDGMHCTTCEAFLESKATNHEGVVGAEASYAGGLLRVGYDPDTVDPSAIPDAVSGLGYEARPVDDADADDGTGPPWRLLVGGFVGMMVMMWYVIFLYPRYFGFTPEDAAWSIGPTSTVSLVNIWLLTTLVLVYTGGPILRGAYVSLRSGHPDMDLLVSLAAVNAYVYSSAVVLTGGTEVYFDISVVIVLVVTLGNYYENRMKQRATASLEDLTEQQVSTARLRTEDGTEQVDVSTLEPGDHVLVKPGERVPIDGTVVEGEAAVDEALVTGESVPVRKEAGDEAIGGTVVTDDALVVRVSDGAQSTLDRLVGLLWRVQSSQPGAQRFADKLATVFVPLVLALSVVAFGWHLLSNAPVSDALLAALAVLVVSCPCALGLATPLAVAAGVRDGLRRGLVVRDASVFETAAETDVVAFDKTGTLTTGEMRVLEAATDDAMGLAAAVEQYASHPVAAAVTDHSRPPEADVTDFTRHPGQGVSATVDGTRVVVGHPDLFAVEDWTVPGDLEADCADARQRGHLPVLVGWDGRARDVLVVGDQPRDDWESVVDDLAAGDHEVVVITGDDDRAAARFRDHPGTDRVYANVRPEAKAQLVERLRADGTVTMVGDGSNDAPALATADLGIALGGTALAADAADVVITNDDLAAVPDVFALTTATGRRIRQNLGWALVYNAIAVPMALLGHVNPLVAAVAMATSSVLVVGNSSRRVIDVPYPTATDSDGEPPGASDVEASTDNSLEEFERGESGECGEDRRDVGGDRAADGSVLQSSSSNRR